MYNFKGKMKYNKFESYRQNNEVYIYYIPDDKVSLIKIQNAFVTYYGRAAHHPFNS